jgi:ATP-dependent protease ClpP protease subunit
MQIALAAQIERKTLLMMERVTNIAENSLKHVAQTRQKKQQVLDRQKQLADQAVAMGFVDSKGQFIQRHPCP